MKKYLDNFYNIFSKIGKRNIVLFFFVLIVLVIARLYSTFSLFTNINETFVDGVSTYEFIIDENVDDNSLTVPSKSSKYVSVKITNPDEAKLRYGLYYSSSDSLSDVYVGSVKESLKPAKGLIDGKDNYVIDLKVLNLSDNTVTINLGIVYGLENGGDLKLEDSKSWVNLYEGPFPLTEAKIGSYVYFEGNSGCSGASCNGTNVNYVDENDKGYCYREDNKFKYDGWRVAYVRKNTSYIISAGSILCGATDGRGSFDTTLLNSYEKSVGLSSHVSNLNKIAVGYCNKQYAYGNVCNSHSTWVMNVIDYKNITNHTLSSDSCFKKVNDKNCGFENSLIDVGSFYWIANSNNKDNYTMYNWDSVNRFINSSHTNVPLGVRPIIRMNDAVYVVSGKGTEKEPYLLDTIVYNENNVIEEDKNTEELNVSNYIQNLYNSAKQIDTVNISNTSYQVKVNKSAGLLLDNNNIYRYYGVDPKNYVMFNDELWRIVSLSNVLSDKKDSKGKMRIKLVRDSFIGKYSYDSSSDDENNGEGYSDWSKSDLMNELKDLYYNQKAGKCFNNKNNAKIDCDFSTIGFDSNARYLVDDAVFYLSEKSNVDDVYAFDYYKDERSDKTWVGKVGIIYGSDYMYSVDFSLCKQARIGYQSNTNCNNSWLYKMHENVISNLENIKPYVARDIYPVVYLKDNIKISDGVGTKDDPFIFQVAN